VIEEIQAFGGEKRSRIAPILCHGAGIERSAALRRDFIIRVGTQIIHHHDVIWFQSWDPASLQ
jgi:hypothetical protein